MTLDKALELITSAAEEWADEREGWAADDAAEVREALKLAQGRILL